MWHRGIVIKSRKELELMRTAGRVNAEALAAAVALVRPGVTTADLDRAASEVLRKNGAQPAFQGYPGPYPYPAVTTVSVNDELVHGIPGRRKLREGDVVSIDCGAVVEGYVADSALSLAVGKVSQEAQRLLDTTRAALFAGIGEMRPGGHVGDISAAIQEFVEGHGFQVVREYSGHGVGRHMHEDPQVPNYGSRGTGILLRPGMTLALEPMVLAGSPDTRVLDDQWTVAAADGRLTAHFEHTVAVTAEGPWVLTALEEDLDLGLGVGYNEYFAGRLGAPAH